MRWLSDSPIAASYFSHKPFHASHLLSVYYLDFVLDSSTHLAFLTFLLFLLCGDSSIHSVIILCNFAY